MQRKNNDRLRRAAATAIGLGIVAPVAAVAAVSTLTSTAAARTAHGNKSAGVALVKIATVAKYGKILENEKGLPLYYDIADHPPGHFACTGKCLHFWPPIVLKKGTLAVPKGASGLGTVKTPSGRQVTWLGKPLYDFINDRAGKVNGEGAANVFFVAQVGKPIEKTPAPGPRATTSTTLKPSVTTTSGMPTTSKGTTTTTTAPTTTTAYSYR